MNDSMPIYTASITAPTGTNPWQVLIRYYAPWGDGSSEGWKIPVSKPQAFINGAETEVAVAFAYSDNYQDSGHVGPGYDQHEQCLFIKILQAIPLQEDMDIVITGVFPQVGYLSATLYFSSVLNPPIPLPIEVVDYDMATNTGLNPYIVGNPSVFSYQVPAVEVDKLNHTGEFRKPNTTLAVTSSYKDVLDGAIPVYRPDHLASVSVLPDDVADDGCSKGYLIAHKEQNQEVLIIRMKVPSTFIHDGNPDVIFGDYQCQEFTIGSHITWDQSQINNFDFWTISSRMLNDYIDEEGYAYVFFASDSYVQQVMNEQQTAPTQPPVMVWGNYTGYLLGDPSYAIILRYKAPADGWIGNPIGAVCYPNAELNQPVTSDELGEFLPEIYGDTLVNFENGIIGAVHNDQPWPETM